ncbi:MAG: hypothetical protein EA397_08060 [Deltaproteobacteria bacterium]|nr:MAG: hypothetical protein EA397_08060 [Deltaproteobacteria bacterium]
MRPLHPTVRNWSILAGLGVVSLFASCQPDPEATSLFNDVGMSFQPCNEAEIRFRNERYNLMPALKVCGSNNVAHFAWNPSGTHLYFDLTLTGNLLDASQAHKPLSTLPLDQPTGAPAWITDTRLAVPIAPDPTLRGSPERIALYDTEQRVLSVHPLPGLLEVTELQRGATASEIYFTALDPQGRRGVYLFDVDESTFAPALAWLHDEVGTFSLTPSADAVVIGSGGTVTLYSMQGEVRGSWPGVRGTVHPGGTWMALEKEGQEVSIFYQRSWENQTRREREINQQRAERMAARYPDWFPKSVRLPTLEFINLNSGHRGELYQVFGTRFQWYPREDFYGSFLLWGYEGKQLNRNIQLGNFALFLGAIERRVKLPEVRLLDRDGRRLDEPDPDNSEQGRAEP